MVASAITGLATAAGGTLISKAFGGGTKKASKAAKNVAPNFSAGGLKGKFNRQNNTYSVASSNERNNLVGGIASNFGEQAGIVRGMRDKIAPGVSDLRTSRLRQIEDAKTAAIGNLRENLQRRRVLGSSFAADAISRSEATFAREKERVEAESFLQELELTQQNIQQEFELKRAEFQTKLGEFNLQAEIATKLTGMASEQLSQASRLEMELAAKSAAGAGKFFGDALQPVFEGLGNWAATAFK
jgi:hypothetical protein